jgi:hypothetical protein
MRDPKRPAVEPSGGDLITQIDDVNRELRRLAGEWEATKRKILGEEKFRLYEEYHKGLNERLRAAQREGVRSVSRPEREDALKTELMDASKQYLRELEVDLNSLIEASESLQRQRSAVVARMLPHDDIPGDPPDDGADPPPSKPKPKPPPESEPSKTKVEILYDDFSRPPYPGSSFVVSDSASELNAYHAEEVIARQA